MGIVQSGLSLVRIGLDCIILQYFNINMIHQLLTLYIKYQIMIKSMCTTNLPDFTTLALVSDSNKISLIIPDHVLRKTKLGFFLFLLCFNYFYLFLLLFSFMISDYFLKVSR
jgi:hypothetical protein